RNGAPETKTPARGRRRCASGRALEEGGPPTPSAELLLLRIRVLRRGRARVLVRLLVRLTGGLAGRRRSEGGLRGSGLSGLLLGVVCHLGHHWLPVEPASDERRRHASIGGRYEARQGAAIGSGA